MKDGIFGGLLQHHVRSPIMFVMGYRNSEQIYDHVIHKVQPDSTRTITASTYSEIQTESAGY